MLFSLPVRFTSTFIAMVAAIVTYRSRKAIVPSGLEEGRPILIQKTVPRSQRERGTRGCRAIPTIPISSRGVETEATYPCGLQRGLGHDTPGFPLTATVSCTNQDCTHHTLCIVLVNHDSSSRMRWLLSATRQHQYGGGAGRLEGRGEKRHLGNWCAHHEPA